MVYQDLPIFTYLHASIELNYEFWPNFYNIMPHSLPKFSVFRKNMTIKTYNQPIYTEFIERAWLQIIAYV